VRYLRVTVTSDLPSETNAPECDVSSTVLSHCARLFCIVFRDKKSIWLLVAVLHLAAVRLRVTSMLFWFSNGVCGGEMPL
jgi:hypothetical protein